MLKIKCLMQFIDYICCMQAANQRDDEFGVENILSAANEQMVGTVNRL